jgi:hypothetical protein
MRIIKQDENHMELADKQLGSLIMAPIVVVIGLVILVVMPGNGRILGGIVVAIGVITLLMRKARSLVVDKSSGQGTFILKSILKNANMPFALGDVAKIELLQGIERVQTNNRTEVRETTSLTLVMKSGDTIDLADGSRKMGFNLFGHRANQVVGEKLAAFMGVPFDVAGGGALMGGMATITTVAPAAPVTPVTPVTPVIPPSPTALVELPVEPPQPTSSL